MDLSEDIVFSDSLAPDIINIGHQPLSTLDTIDQDKPSSKTKSPFYHSDFLAYNNFKMFKTAIARLSIDLQKKADEYTLDDLHVGVGSWNVAFIKYTQLTQAEKQTYVDHIQKTIIDSFKKGLWAINLQDTPEELLFDLEKIGIVSASQIVQNKQDRVYNISIFNPLLNTADNLDIKTIFLPSKYQKYIASKEASLAGSLINLFEYKGKKFAIINYYQLWRSSPETRKEEWEYVQSIVDRLKQLGYVVMMTGDFNPRGDKVNTIQGASSLVLMPYALNTGRFFTLPISIRDAFVKILSEGVISQVIPKINSPVEEITNVIPDITTPKNDPHTNYPFLNQTMPLVLDIETFQSLLESIVRFRVDYLVDDEMVRVLIDMLECYSMPGTIMDFILTSDPDRAIATIRTEFAAVKDGPSDHLMIVGKMPSGLQVDN